MADIITQLPSLDLGNAEIERQFRKRIDGLILSDNAEEARYLIKVLQAQLKQNTNLKSAIRERYERMLHQAHWVALDLLDHRQAVELFRNHLREALGMRDYPILRKVRMLLMGVIDLAARDQFKKELRSALENNTQRLTSEALERNGRQFPPTVAQWIHEFDREIGPENISDRLKEAQFLSENKNIQKLNDDERQQVVLLIHLYERLVLSSLTLEGMEEPVPIDNQDRRGIIRGGVFEEIKPEEMARIYDFTAAIEKKVAASEPLQDQPATTVFQQWRRHIAEIPEIMKRAHDIIGRAAADPEKIKEQFTAFIVQQDRRSVIACLYILANQKEFFNYFKSKSDLIEKFKKYIVIKYESIALGKYVQSNLGSPVVVKELLQFLLEDRMLMNRGRAVLVALDVGPLLGEKYKQFGYPDDQQNSYVWTEVKSDGKRLILGMPPPDTVDITDPLEGKEETEFEAETIQAPVSPTEPSGDMLERLRQKYQTYRAQRSAILRMEDELMMRTHGDVERLKQELSSATRNGEKKLVIAALKMLARQGALGRALQESRAWLQSMSEFIEKRYTDQFGPAAAKQAVGNLRMTPITPIAISEFLQYLLREKIKLSENDSALIGVEIGQLLGEEYQSMAYGNQETGNFEWTKHRIENNKLVSEL